MLMDIYKQKELLSQEYQNMTRDDLLWILALKTFKQNKATFAGSFTNYFKDVMGKADKIRILIKFFNEGGKI